MQDFMKYDFNVNKILLAGFVRSGEGAPVHTNRASHGLALYVDGGCCFRFGDKKLYTKKNDLIYLPKHSDYTVEQTEKADGITCYAINFDISATTDFSPFVISIKNASALLRLFQNAEQVWRTKKSGFQMECKAHLYHMICAIRREYELGYISSTAAHSLSPALSHIHVNYTNESIDIPHLASLCGMSETYFRIIFKKAHGISPLKYINSLKLTRAKELLASRMYSVTEVSQLAGFRDESYFSREFKKATGFCPSCWPSRESGKKD